jgi:hypothetical protein
MCIRQAVNVCLGRIKRRGSTDVCCSIPGLDAVVSIMRAVMCQKLGKKGHHQRTIPRCPSDVLDVREKQTVRLRSSVGHTFSRDG